MTDTQWAERITALAKDRVRERLSTFDNDIMQAVRNLLKTGQDYGRCRLYEHQTLGWFLRDTVSRLDIPTNEPGKVSDETWKKKMQEEEEAAIREEMLAKLDIFGQLRKAKGEDWAPKNGGE
jgi:hypothetical protein